MEKNETVRVSLSEAARGLVDSGCADAFFEGMFVSLSAAVRRFQDDVSGILCSYKDVAAVCRLSVACGATVDICGERELIGMGLFGVRPSEAAGMLLDNAVAVEVEVEAEACA